MNSFTYLYIGASVALAMSITNALASSPQSEDIVSNQMLKCLKLPPNAPKAYSILAVAILKDGGTDFVSVNFRAPPSDWEINAAPLIADAITQCEPYSAISGKVEFIVTPELVEGVPKN